MPQQQTQERADNEETLRQSAKVAAEQMMEALKQCETLGTALQQAKQEADGV